MISFFSQGQIHFSGFALFVLMIYVKKLELIQIAILAPIKRPLSRKNTSPSQKMMSFFCRDIIQYEISPLSLSASGFSKFIGADSYSICYQAPIRIKASERKDKSCRAKRRGFHYLVAKQPFFFFAAPGPESGPQKNIGSLSCPMGCDKIKGSKRANHRGLMTRADHKKRTSAWIFV